MSNNLYEQIYADLLNFQDELTQIEFIQNDSSDIQYINNPSNKLIELALDINPSNIRYINQSNYYKKIALKKDINTINCINDMDKEIQLFIFNILPEKIPMCIFYNLYKFTSSLFLFKLSKKLDKESIYYKNITSSKYWKDDANLILEVINEKEY